MVEAYYASAEGRYHISPSVPLIISPLYRVIQTIFGKGHQAHMQTVVVVIQKVAMAKPLPPKLLINTTVILCIHVIQSL